MTRASPPRWIESLLARCLPRDVRGRSILGDLHETLGARYRSGDVRAAMWYGWQALRIAVRYAPSNAFRTTPTRGRQMNGFVQDARYALRTIRRDLRFFLFAAVIIGIGVGANTAVFSVMSPLMLRPLPFADSERLVWVANSGAGGMSGVTSRTSNLRDYRELNRSFDSLTGYFAFFEYMSYTLLGDGTPERLVGVNVAQDFLDVLGVRPRYGRNFVPEEGVWAGPSVAILTHGLWTRRFGSDPTIVGRSITLNDQPTQVVGVLPPTFDFASTFTPGSRVDFLLPFPISDETDQWGNTTAIIGRLRPGATIESAQADLDGINRRLQDEQPRRGGLGAVVSGLQDHISGRFRSAMGVLAAAAAAVMLIACANLSNLLLARGPRRQKEMAVRSALGATRHRLVRQLLLESLMLALCGGLIGVLIALAATRAVAGTTAFSIPMLHAVSLDATALWFTLGISLLAGLLVGIIPALQMSAGREATVIRESGRRTSESKRHTRLRELLVVCEMALACVLVVSGGLLLRSFVSVLDVELGFEPSGVTAWRVEPGRSIGNVAAANVYYDQLVASVLALPGVEAVGITDTPPLGRNRSWGIRAQGVFYEEGEAPTFFPRMVDWRYLEAMRIPLLAGRYLNAFDTEESGRSIVINQTAAERLFPDQDPIGRTALLGNDEEWQVVGVVADVRHQSLEEESGLEGYMPITQQDDWGALEMVVRSSIPPSAIVHNVRSVLAAVDPTLATGDFRTLDAVVDRAVSPRRFILLLLGAFAATALLLAAIGIYGVLSYSVTQRTAEIGIRMALGESGMRVLSRVMGRTVALASIGLAIGLVGALASARLIRSLLYGVGPADSLTIATVAVTLLVVSALAGYLPARRAARTQPAVALQSS